jgi:serine phosphatase RsbU (regulator of sigma subunit)/antitoxin component YwqK of YwqJK toxin-antitoxin module
MNQMLQYKFYFIFLLLFYHTGIFASPDNKRFFCSGSAFETGIPSKSLKYIYVDVYQVKPDSLFKKSFRDFPQDSSILKKILTVDADNDERFEFQLELNSEYVLVYKSYGDVYYPANYYINTRVPGNKQEQLFKFFYQINMDKKDQNSAIKRRSIRRICVYHEKKEYFIGTNIIVAPKDSLRDKEKSTLVTSRADTESTNKSGSAGKIILDRENNSAIVIRGDTINRIGYDNKRKGKWAYSNESGHIVFTGNYADDKKEGLWLKHYLNDSVEVSMEFINNLSTGDYKLFYQDGKLMNEGVYDNNRQIFIGMNKGYAKSGELIKLLNYNNDGLKTGRQFIFYPSGKMAVSASMAKNILNGSLLLYDAEGKLCLTREYKNGTLIREEHIMRSRINKNALIAEITKDEKSTASHLRQFMNELSNAEGKYAQILADRNKELSDANLMILRQKIALQKQKEFIGDISLMSRLQADRIRQQKYFLYWMGSVIGFIFLFLGFVVWTYLNSKKANRILSEKNQVISQKNSEILDSITYARRIQTAILPPDRQIKAFLKNSFILYLPKDIVAGDFYWMESIDESVYFAACDCTGHGVPGAMVSVVCNNALNRALHEFGERMPGNIFDKTRQLVMENFAKSDEEVNDGMDASLCVLDINTRKLRWSGANNPIWIYRASEKRMQEIKPDKQAIGRGYEFAPFTTHELELEKGDIIYIFTDGYADQFGGVKGKKLTKAKFREYMLHIAELPMETQREKLLAQHDEWRGKLEQVDDICVIGVRV